MLSSQTVYVLGPLHVGIQLCYLRHLGRVLGPDEVPHAKLLGLVAAQLKVSPGVWDLYANRDQTRREHLRENSRKGILCTPSVNSPRKQSMSFRTRSVTRGKSFLRAFSREKRYLTCVNFLFLSSAQVQSRPPLRGRVFPGDREEFVYRALVIGIGAILQR
jgi:Domain of unknown function (DUF4158)